MKVDRTLLQVPQELQKTMFGRTITIAALGVLFVLVLVFRLYQLQVVDHDRYATRSIDNWLSTQPLAPARGLIYDRNGVALARNRQVQSLSVVGEHIEDIDELLTRVREIVEFSTDEEEQFRKRHGQLTRPGETVILKRHLSNKELAVFAVNRYRYPDIFVTAETLREYPFNGVMAHAVGSVRQMTKNDKREMDAVTYMATKFVGRRGIEKFYEDILHGDVGYRKVEVNVHGRVMQELSRETPLRGATLTLHLDSELQQAAHDALGDRRGAVVAIEPSTGGILAMVSTPTYNPNDFVMGMTDESFVQLSNRRDTPLFNRATQGIYPPGSTIKPIIGLAALSLDVVDWEYEIFDANGEFRLTSGGRVYRDWNWTESGAGGQRELELHRAIYRSSNIFFYDLGTKIDIDDLAHYVKRFGYGSKTAIDVADTAEGLVPTRDWKRNVLGESWNPGDNMNIFIGQGAWSVTPLQLATAVTVIANRGRFVRPRLLMSSNHEAEADSEMLEAIADVEEPSPEDWELMVDAMRSVIHRGNQGYLGNGIAWVDIGMDIPYEMAGKSGTAQVKEIAQGEVYDEEILTEYERKHALFVAFAPVQNPVIAIAVVVENGGGGSSVAGPVARSVLDVYMARQGLIASE